MKKFISLFLSLMLICSCVAPAIADTIATTNTYPVIDVNGRTKSTPIYNKDGKQVNPTEVQTDLITEGIKECMPAFAKALATGDYQPWVDKVIEFIKPIYSEMLPDKNGDITDGSAPTIVSGTPGSSIPDKKSDIEFLYDWREDPYETAEKLHNVVQSMKEQYNIDKVSLVGRCYGCNIIAAYLDAYKDDLSDIASVVFIASAASGAAAANCGLTGSFDINPNYFENYLGKENYSTGVSITGDTVTDQLLYSAISFINTFYGLNSLEEAGNFVVDKLFPIVGPAVLRESYGRFASVWSMVNAENYEKAKTLIFGGYEEEYKGLIEKTDRYHNFQVNLVDNIKALQAKFDFNVGVIALYNTSIAPVLTDAQYQADDTVVLTKASMGATCANFGEVLSDEYLKGKDKKYVSSDHIIDASTCAFPDKTFFIKDLEHSYWNTATFNLAKAIAHGGNDFTVDNNGEKYTQFMKTNAKKNGFEVLTDEPVKEGGILEKIEVILTKFLNFFEQLTNYFFILLDKIKAKTQTL